MYNKFAILKSGKNMKALIWEDLHKIKLIEKPKPQILDPRDAIVKVTLSSICTSDLHIINGAVPNAHKGITLGHEFVGEIVELGPGVTNLSTGDRVSANCETFCGECYFCKHGFINNCQNGGWKLGCCIDGCQAEYVRVPFADTGLTKIPDSISYSEALFVGDILSSGYFGTELCEVKPENTVAVIGCGPVGICAMQCARAMGAKQIIGIDTDDYRLNLVKNNGYTDFVINPDKQNVCDEVLKLTQNRGADCVIEAAGGNNTFQMAWQIARANAIVAIVAMYEQNQILPLPEMYGKNLIFKTGGVDALHCLKLLKMIENKEISTGVLISKYFDFNDIECAYNYFKNKCDNCLKVALKYV